MKNPGHYKPVRLFISSIFILVSVIAFQSTATIAADTPKAPTVIDLIESKPEEDSQTALAAAVTKAVPQDEFDRGTPLSSFKGLSDALKDHNFERSINYLDLRNLPAHLTRDSLALAQKLKIIFDRALLIDYDTISDDPKGHQDDGLPSYRDIIARLKAPDGTVDILMQHVPDGKGNHIWIISNRTVSEIPYLYKQYGYGEFGDKLSRMLPSKVEFLGMMVWQWVMLLVISLVAFAISWIITWIATLFLRLRKKHSYIRLQTFIAGPVRFLIFTFILRSNFDLIAPTLTTKAFFEAKTMTIIAITWLVIGLVGFVFGRLGDRMRDQGNAQAIVLLRPAVTLVKVIVILIAFISWLDNLGFNVSAMLTGLGVGGIAIGFAAQKSIENLIGGITLYAAQPIRIGDFCRIGSTLGVVEEIGLRATMIRTLDRILVTIPNSSMVNMDIENLTKRDKILYRRTVRLRNDTTPDQIRVVLDGVREMFKSHPDVDPEPARIRFTEYGEHSLNLEIFTYIKTNDFDEYLESIEDLNLRILDIIFLAGTQLALPARSVRLEGKAVPAE